MTNLPSEYPGPGSMRASDSDRDRVAEALREAAAEGRLSLDELDERLDRVFAAKTYADLVPLTSDLPSSGPGSPGPLPTVASAAQVNRYGGQAAGNLALAILGAFTRKGNWVAPAEMTAVAILGGGEIDLREARFAEHTMTIHAVTIMGGIVITVPEDADVQVDGIGIMGAFDHTMAGGGTPGGPRIIVNGVAFWGGVQIQRKPADTPRAKLDPGHKGELSS